MDYIREQFYFQDEFRFMLFETATRQALVHCHECLEINYVERGSGYYIIEQKSYPIQAGDIFIINNAERHMAVHGKDFSILVMLFDSNFVWENPKDYDFLGPFFNRSSHFSNRIRNDNESYLELCEYIQKIVKEYVDKKNGWRMVVKATVMLFLAVLYRYYQNNNELGGDIKNFHKSYERIRPILDYVHEHFAEHIGLEELAKQVMLSKTYMCSYFKEIMKLTIFEYIEQVRINHGCMLLKTTEIPITEIALQSGFNSISYFNRVFKKILGISPRVYKAETQNSEKSKYSAETKYSAITSEPY